MKNEWFYKNLLLFTQVLCCKHVRKTFFFQMKDADYGKHVTKVETKVGGFVWNNC